MINVFVICTGNSCRSILGEALFNHLGAGRVRAFSAGSHPIGKINQNALATLQRHGLATAGYQSQSWHEFANQPMDIVITVCDNARKEACPFYLNKAVRVHWGLADPSHVQGTENAIIAAFENTYRTLEVYINKMLSQPLESMSPAQLSIELNALAHHED
ncbi:MAG: arsenate reductase ArsC [Methyloprofundus sp.]|nr:arsenate reductase ArsC [Methyloprofundus sp.]MBW6453827.1 arsenate reductase ArsC [Methyloprofundus sp.]